MLQTLSQQPNDKNVAPGFDMPREMPARGARPGRLPGGWTYGRAVRAGKRMRRLRQAMWASTEEFS